MLNTLRKRWFLLALLVLIPGGLALGTFLSPENSPARIVNPRITTAFVLLLMALSLDSRQLKLSLRSPTPVLWASLVNFGFIPLAGWALSFAQLTPDFAVGLMIAASVPCTLAAASVWTRKAGGNDAVSLLVTLLTNAACFALTPFWLNLATSSRVQLDIGDMVVRLLVVVLLPTLAGQALRMIPAMGRFATRYKTPMGVVAQSCILVLVFGASCKAGSYLQTGENSPSVASVSVVWGSCIGLHLTAMAVGVTGGKAWRFSRADWTAVAFAGSQKTLPIGVLLATDPTMFGSSGIPFAVFPILMYHASQLFIDTAVADRLAAGVSDADAGPA